MVLIAEDKIGNEIQYKQIIKDEKKIISETHIVYYATEVHRDGRIFYLLYDKNMNPNEEVFDYINDFLYLQSENSQSKALYALKFLYCFQDIIGKELYEFSASDIVALKSFLRGFNRKGNFLSYENLTSRSAETVNGYLSIYRGYLDFLGKQNVYLSARIETGCSLRENFEWEIKKEKYRYNEYTKRKEEIPMYISLEEFWKIIQIVRAEYTIREECIIRLMYETGMRIGEVLGLTNEDIQVNKIDDEYRAVVFIRNRTTDKRYQNAKTCKKVKNKKEYKTKDYQTQGYGYQFVFITEELYDLLGEYIDEEHDIQRQRHRDNYISSTLADSVENSGENFYVFINSLGRPLSDVSWGTIIREIFIKANISLDLKIREHNVSHRFRHGFAMFQIQYLHIKAKELAVLMRHTSIASVMKYYRPTVSDKVKLKTQFADELYNMLPGLRQFREDM